MLKLCDAKGIRESLCELTAKEQSRARPKALRLFGGCIRYPGRTAFGATYAFRFGPLCANLGERRINVRYASRAKFTESRV